MKWVLSPDRKRPESSVGRCGSSSRSAPIAFLLFTPVGGWQRPQDAMPSHGCRWHRFDDRLRLVSHLAREVPIDRLLDVRAHLEGQPQPGLAREVEERRWEVRRKGVLCAPAVYRRGSVANLLGNPSGVPERGLSRGIGDKKLPDLLRLLRLETERRPEFRHGVLAPFGKLEGPQDRASGVVADSAQIAGDVVVVDHQNGRRGFAHAREMVPASPARKFLRFEMPRRRASDQQTSRTASDGGLRLRFGCLRGERCNPPPCPRHHRWRFAPVKMPPTVPPSDLYWARDRRRRRRPPCLREAPKPSESPANRLWTETPTHNLAQTMGGCLCPTRAALGRARKARTAPVLPISG
jgi:hypothetical protein